MLLNILLKQQLWNTLSVECIIIYLTSPLFWSYSAFSPIFITINNAAVNILIYRSRIACSGDRSTTHSRILAWRIPRTEETGGPQSMGSQRVRHDWGTNASLHYILLTGFPGGTSGNESTCQCRRPKRPRFHLWAGMISWSRQWHPIPVFLPGKSHEQRSLVGQVHGVAKSDMSGRLSTDALHTVSMFHAQFPRSTCLVTPREESYEKTHCQTDRKQQPLLSE